MHKRWEVRDADHSVARAIAGELDLPLPLVTVLVGRGFNTAVDIDRFLNPRLSGLSDPFLIPGLEDAVERIFRAIDEGQSILVFGDYDVDGISSTALLISFLNEIGVSATPYLPSRITDGYGFTEEVARRCIEENRPQLIITVDCGTGSVEAVDLAAKQGVDVVVTDHHEPGDVVAGACAVVNPKLGEDPAVAMLAGVGVTFKLCHGLLKHARDRGRAGAEDVDLRAFLDLAALGTIADIVPMVEENRVLARHGLHRLQHPRLPGLKSLMEIAGIRSDVRAHHIGFQIGPRLNAAGRMGDANTALELLLTNDAARAKDLALRLDGTNRERQDTENRILRAALEELRTAFDPEKDFSIVLAGEDWHPGVIGIVASRLCQQHVRPVVVIGIDEDGIGRGSCRSIPDFNLIEHLQACEETLLNFGGHNMAAGLTVEQGRISAFRERFNHVARETLGGKDLRPLQRVDAWLELSEADEWLIECLEKVRPFGSGNPSPTWAVRNLRVVEHRVVGKGHLQMTLAGGGKQADAIGFGMGEREIPDGPVDVAFHLKMNRYMGRESIRLDIQDFRPAAAN